RNPASVVVIDTHSGKTIQNIPIGEDVDDLYLDTIHHRLYASWGGVPNGEIDVLDLTTTGKFKPIDMIETPSGARTCFFDERMKKLFLAVPKRGSQQAEVRV